MIRSAALGLAGLLTLAAAPVPPAPPAPPAPVAAPAAPDAPRSPAGAAPAAPAAPHVIIIKDGKVISDGMTGGSNVQVITTGDGKDGKQIKTVVLHRQDGAGTPGVKRIIVRCIKKAKLVDGKEVVTEASKDCDNIDMPDVNKITADAMKEAGVEIAMIRPTIESALREARAEIAGNSDLSAEQKAKALAGIDTAIRETMKDKPGAK
jgi:bla regulator protein BlaR1